MVSLHCQKRHRLLLSHNPPQNLRQVPLSTRSRARTPPGPALRFLLGGARSLLLQKLHPRWDGSAVRLDRVRNSLISSPCGAPAEMLGPCALRREHARWGCSPVWPESSLWPGLGAGVAPALHSSHSLSLQPGCGTGDTKKPRVLSPRAVPERGVSFDSDFSELDRFGPPWVLFLREQSHEQPREAPFGW